MAAVVWLWILALLATVALALFVFRVMRGRGTRQSTHPATDIFVHRRYAEPEHDEAQAGKRRAADSPRQQAQK